MALSDRQTDWIMCVWLLLISTMTNTTGQLFSHLKGPRRRRLNGIPQIPISSSKVETRLLPSLEEEEEIAMGLFKMLRTQTLVAAI